ncbi:hypothetical protein CEXT_332161 [Caerostris extrusa]|uniref:Transmembrane protein n=1 Tax=Caerostris extrusa TaxID=172846 RepID=A0AAV4QIB4_CAEEX|nr:hypothetical protein CEXT_332161 [Caerostris extrusa]
MKGGSARNSSPRKSDLLKSTSRRQMRQLKEPFTDRYYNNLSLFLPLIAFSLFATTPFNNTRKKQNLICLSLHPVAKCANLKNRSQTDTTTTCPFSPTLIAFLLFDTTPFSNTRKKR